MVHILRLAYECTYEVNNKRLAYEYTYEVNNMRLAGIPIMIIHHEYFNHPCIYHMWGGYN